MKKVGQMNRAQRRMAERKKPDSSRALSRSKAWQAIQTKMFMHSTDALAPEDINELLMRPYATLTRLMSYSIDDNDFIDLNQTIISAFCLASELHAAVKCDVLSAQIAQSQHFFEVAADAMRSMGERKHKAGKYRATGDELGHIREAMGWYTELLPIANRGLVLKALIRAETMVNERLEKLARH